MNTNTIKNFTICGAAITLAGAGVYFLAKFKESLTDAAVDIVRPKIDSFDTTTLIQDAVKSRVPAILDSSVKKVVREVTDELKHEVRDQVRRSVSDSYSKLTEDIGAKMLEQASTYTPEKIDADLVSWARNKARESFETGLRSDRIALKEEYQKSLEKEIDDLNDQYDDALEEAVDDLKSKFEEKLDDLMQKYADNVENSAKIYRTISERVATPIAGIRSAY